MGKWKNQNGENCMVLDERKFEQRLVVDDARLQKILDSSHKVLLDCCLENGAIVAANSDKQYYPKHCQCYRFVWPTDAAYTLLALKALGETRVQEHYFAWLWERCEDVQNDGLLFQNYYTHGIKRWIGFQPDSNGKTLWLLYDFFDGKIPAKWMPLMKKLTEGLLRVWDKDHFIMRSQDRWEERFTYPDLKDNHIYSLAACIKGLKCALLVMDDELLKKSISSVITQMESAIEHSFLRNEDDSSKAFGKSYFFRTSGILSDPVVDSLVLGLVWPFFIFRADDARMIQTIDVLESCVVRKGGVLRYEHDQYDGWVHHGDDRRKGAGAWPLLNFMMSIYWSKRGDKVKARQYFDWVVLRCSDMLPEQVFENNMQVGITPLAWSHAMFIFAGIELRLFRFVDC